MQPMLMVKYLKQQGTRVKMSLKTILIGGLVLGAVVIVGNNVDAQTPPKPTASGSRFEDRLVQRKAERRIVLDAKRDVPRIQATCTQAQGKLRGIQQSAGSVLENRRKVYQRIDAKLWVIIGRLRLSEKDTFKLEKLRATYSGEISKFQSDSTNYRQVLDDLTIVNCQADPVGFKALLETSRIYHKRLLDQSAVINKYVVNDVKNELAAHVTGLTPNPATEGQ
jgi:hypothetical protein